MRGLPTISFLLKHAAGRAVLPEVSAGASLPFQAFLQGNPSGARLEASAPATTFG
jgi:hypothetical protein